MHDWQYVKEVHVKQVVGHELHINWFGINAVDEEVVRNVEIGHVELQVPKYKYELDTHV